MVLAGITAFASTDASTSETNMPSLVERAVEVPASGWSDLGGAVYSPSEGIFQVVYGDFGNGDEFAIVEVVGF